MAGYTRQSTFADGDTITAALFNNEYNQLLNAFSNTGGHKHDGTANEGPVIGLIGDAGETAPNNKVLIDTTNNYIEFYVQVSGSPVQQLYIADGAIVPVTDNDIDLGTSSLQFKDLYINGTANIDSLVLATGSTVTAVLDEDDLSSDSATSLVTQQSVKAYIDAQVTAQDLDFLGDSGGALSIDLDSESLTIAGGTGLDTVGSGNTVTVNIDATVATLTGSQTLTNKTIDVDNNTVSNIEVDNFKASAIVLESEGIGSNDNDTSLPTSAAVKDYVDTQITAEDLDITTDSGTIAIDLDSETLTVSGGTGLDSSATGNAVTLAIDSTVTTLTGSQTLTNKTLTSPDVNTPDIDGGTIDGATIATSDVTVGAGKTLDVSAGTLTLADNQISGDKVEGGTIAATTITDLTFGSLNDGTITATAFVDEDNMASNSATLIPTQQSVKAYVDTTVAATNEVVEDTTPQLGGDLDLNSSDITGTGNINITGTIQSSGNITGTLATAAQPNITSLGTLTGLTTTGNLVIGTEDNNSAILEINGGATGNAEGGEIRLDIAADYDGTYEFYRLDVSQDDFRIGRQGQTDFTLFSDGTAQFFGNVAATLSTAAQPNITSVGTLSGLTVSGDLLVDTNTLFVDSSEDVVGINTTSNLNQTLNVLGTSSDTIDETTGVVKFEATGGNGLLFGTQSSSPFRSYIQSAYTVDTSLAQYDLLLNPLGGNVGIGTTSPSATLDVNGTIKLDGNYPTGVENVALGDTALDSVEGGGQWNTAIGAKALTATTTGDANTGVGRVVLEANTTGGNNTALGYGSLNANTTASNNTAVGYLALLSNTTGGGNTAVGYNTLDANTTGQVNVAVGQGALSANTTANYNVGIGVDALGANITGTENVALGALSLQANTTGNYNTGLGRAALYNNTTASDNTAVGWNSLLSNTTGTGNTAVGKSALDNNTTASNNTAVGYLALDANTTGELNVALGRSSLSKNTTAGGNVGIGGYALNNNTTGAANIGIGQQALNTNTTASSNTAVGFQSLYANTASNNTAVGRSTLNANTTGTNNTAVGTNSLLANTTGDENVAMGVNALDANTTGANNTGIGTSALGANTTASNNTAVGQNALVANTTGSENTAVGLSALAANTTAASNSAFGFKSLFTNTTGIQNTGLGESALRANTTASNNTAVGFSALTANTTGTSNVAMGSYSLDANTTGNYNVGVGEATLSSNTTANSNTAVGFTALVANTTGTTNTAIGAEALDANTTASDNTAVGYHALSTTQTGAANTAMGRGALFSNTANHNTAIGYLASSANTTGTQNVSVGMNALRDCTSGSSNTALGEGAQIQSTTASQNVALGRKALFGNTTGSDNTCLGFQAGDAITTGHSNVIIGINSDVASADHANTIIIGDAVTGVGGNNFTFGNSTNDSNIQFGATSITAPSDIRLKEDIQDEEVGLNFINDLRPVTFQWKKEKDIPSDMRAYKEGSEERTMNGKYNHGFIAQEVKEVIDNHNLKDGFDMWQEDEADGRQRVAPAAIMSVMVKAVQELSTTVDELKAEIQTLKGE